MTTHATPPPSPAHTNALARETSPYLLQHAHNPVDWLPWGPRALALARERDQPIFLSIGYSTCYWCHVMERQCFEDPAIAAQMNREFVCIKVDREERPDLDDLYMAALQAMTGRGGWPMSLFLTPPGDAAASGAAEGGLKPFYAGTYFPPTPMHGSPGFPQVLAAVARAWREQRPAVLEQAERAAQAVAEHLSGQRETAALGPELVQAAANQLARTYDAEHGGFGGAPKFPQACNLAFLLRVQRNNPNPDLWHALLWTLESMARGGMYDQIAGGFHRYATDARWLVPHFEKMLYDQAQLIEVYLGAHSLAPHPADPDFFPRVVRQTCDYLLREMTDAGGGYWSAQDAEVEAREGGSHIWQVEQVRQALAGEPDAQALTDWALRLYGLDQGTNFQDPHHPEAEPANVLHLPAALHELARREGVAIEELLARKSRVDGLLLATRAQRPQPATDDKVLTAWNGLAIAALARAGQVLAEPRYAAAAERAGQFLLSKMGREQGRLWRVARAGQARVPAFLEDYAAAIHAAIHLHRTGGDGKWLEAAARWADVVEHDFGPASAPGTGGPSGGYFDTLAGQADLFVRTRGSYDGAIPSGNSQMVHNLLDLHEATRQRHWLERAARDLASFAATMARLGPGMCHMHHALLRALELGLPAEAPAEAPAGSDGPVTVILQPTSVPVESGELALELVVDIAPGYHVTAADAGLEGPQAVTLRLEGAPGWELRATFPEGLQRRPVPTDAGIAVYERRITVPVVLRRGAAGPLPASARLVFRYQACTERECLPPAVVELRITAG